MKFNFGTGLVIAMGLFMIFILQYVIRVQIDSTYDNELVTENYYQQEVEIDGKREREINALTLNHHLTIDTDVNGIIVHFPKEFDYKKITGKVLLYRPSNQNLDFDMEIAITSSNLLVPSDLLVDGRWNVVVEWSYDGVSYRNEEKLNLGNKVN